MWRGRARIQRLQGSCGELGAGSEGGTPSQAPPMGFPPLGRGGGGVCCQCDNEAAGDGPPALTWGIRSALAASPMVAASRHWGERGKGSRWAPHCAARESRESAARRRVGTRPMMRRSNPGERQAPIPRHDGAVCRDPTDIVP